MSDTPIIFCDPFFLGALKERFPAMVIRRFASDITSCQMQIASSDIIKQKTAWLLYRSMDNQLGNLIVKDHINLSGENPLVGPVDLSKGSRFPDMSSVYETHGKPGVVVVQGEDQALEDFEEPWAPVSGGVWEAIMLKHRGYTIHAWLIADLEKWVIEAPLLN
ncbi:hypothetical protein HQ531_00760 [bacterium]|nr:hypothetical protein [bacterium]